MLYEFQLNKFDNTIFCLNLIWVKMFPDYLRQTVLAFRYLSLYTIETFCSFLFIISQDLRAFLDGARNGAIVISLGSNLKWKFFDLNKIKNIILALSKLKQRILWKIDIEVPFEIPGNVMTMKWIPQNEVLCTFPNS